MQKWKNLRNKIKADVCNCEKIIKATEVLHNYIKVTESFLPLEQRKHFPFPYRRKNLDQNLTQIDLRRTNHSKIEFRDIRTVLANFFMSADGSVPWQEDIVLRSANSSN